MESPDQNSSQTDPSLRTGLGLTLVVFLSYFYTAGVFGGVFQMLSIVFCAAAIIFHQRMLCNGWVWLAIGSSVMISFLQKPLDMANHHLLIGYLGLAIGLCLTATEEQRRDLIRHNARWLIIILMGIATIQRLFQSTFMNGEYVGYMLVRGSFLEPITSRFDVFSENKKMIGELRQVWPFENQVVELTQPFPYFAEVTFIFVAIILLIEALVCLAFVLFNKTLVPHILLIMFGVTLSFIRQELVFISVVCLLGHLATFPAQVKLRYLYSFLVLCLVGAKIYL